MRNIKNKRTIQNIIFITIVGLLILGGIHVFRSCTKTGRRAEIQRLLRKAEKLGQEGKYAEALRGMFDAMYQEERALWFFTMRSHDSPSFPPEGPFDKEFPLTVGGTLKKFEQQIIQEDPSPLMQWFRDPDAPIHEKLETIVDLHKLAAKPGQIETDVVSQDRYQGMFGQLIDSPLLHPEEKYDLLAVLQSLVQNRYLSKTQYQQILQDILNLQQRATEQFQTQQYVEALVLLDEAWQTARDLDYFGTLIEQSVAMRDVVLQTDESPLMQLFKNPQLSSWEKRQTWSALWDHAMHGEMKPFFFEGATYNGLLVQILSHPKIARDTKVSFLRKIETMLEQDKKSSKPE